MNTFRLCILMILVLTFSFSISGQIKPKQSSPTKNTQTNTKPDEYPVPVPIEQLNFINKYCGYDIATDQKWNEVVKDLDRHTAEISEILGISVKRD